MSVDVKNVLLVTIDSLRYDYVGCYGHGSATTPTLDALADVGIKFEEAIATASHTKDSFPGILTSSLPSEQGQHHISADKTTIAEVFRNAGFQTAGFHSTPMMNAANNYNAGFEEFVDLAEHEDGRDGLLSSVVESLPRPMLDIGHQLVEKYNLVDRSAETSSTVEADAVTDRVLEYFEASDDEQKFLFVHYMDVHTPYDPPSEYREMFLEDRLSDARIRDLNDRLLENKNLSRGDPSNVDEDELELIKSLYEATVRFVDDEIARIVDYLKENDEWDETLLVITADHGEEFGEHSGFFHGQKLYEELIRVPLIVTGGPIVDHTVENQVSLLDLAPTVLGVCGFEPAASMRGESHVSILNGGQPHTEYALAEATVKKLGRDVGRTIACRGVDRRKLIYNETDVEWTNEQFEFYDLVEDPKEQRNMINEVSETQKQDLKERIEMLKDGDISQDDQGSEAEDRLRALGYLE